MCRAIVLIIFLCGSINSIKSQAQLIKLADMTAQDRVATRKMLSDDMLRKIHKTIISVGMRTHINKNLILKREGRKIVWYYIDPIDEPKTHEVGMPFDEKIYTHRVLDTLESMIFGRFQDEPRRESLTYGGLQEAHQIALWQSLTQDNKDFMALCRNYGRWPRFLPKPEVSLAGQSKNS